MIKTLAAIPHRLRAIFFMVGTLVFYCLWLWVIGLLGWFGFSALQ